MDLIHFLLKELGVWAESSSIIGLNIENKALNADVLRQRPPFINALHHLDLIWAPFHVFSARLVVSEEAALRHPSLPIKHPTIPWLLAVPVHSLLDREDLELASVDKFGVREGAGLRTASVLDYASKSVEGIHDVFKSDLTLMIELVHQIQALGAWRLVVWQLACGFLHFGRGGQPRVQLSQIELGSRTPLLHGGPHIVHLAQSLQVLIVVNSFDKDVNVCIIIVKLLRSSRSRNIKIIGCRCGATAKIGFRHVGAGGGGGAVEEGDGPAAVILDPGLPERGIIIILLILHQDIF